MRRGQQARAAAVPVAWLGEREECSERVDPSFRHRDVHFYNQFRFKNIIASVGDFVLISNADSAEPDTEEGCDAAQLVTLYESQDPDLEDCYRARVQWFSRPGDLPSSVLNNGHIDFANNELIEDHRPFDVDVSIETFFKRCHVVRGSTSQDPQEIVLGNDSKLLTYICRYRLTPLNKRKFNLEPVMEDERRTLELLKTPMSKKNTPSKAKTPSSLIKRMDRVSLSEQRNWSVSNTEGTKILLKRAILTDNMNKNDRGSQNTTPKKEKVTSTGTLKKNIHKQILHGDEINNILSMELEENSDEDIPTLIIRQHTLTPATPKRKNSIISVVGSAKATPRRLVEEAGFETPGRRLARSTKKAVRYSEYDDNSRSPIKSTPRKYTPRTTLNSVRKRLMSDSDDEFLCTPRPSSTKQAVPKTPGTRTPKRGTPRRIVSQLTPTLHARTHSVDNGDNDWNKENRELPGREQQMDEILSFVRTRLLDGASGCMYISGVPGTGKTATVCAALRLLKDESGLPTFQLVEVNGMRIAEPRQAYVHIYRQLTGKSVAWEQACSLLEKRFTNPGPRRTPTVLLVDELDALCTRRQDVLYSIMEWAAHGTARLAVLAVANTMDLPERALAARVASRLGLTRLTFPPYTHTQLQRIVATRLVNANVTPDAVQLIARKVAAVSGDARRALSLCGRALELAQQRGDGEGAGLREVQLALSEAASGATVRAIRSCSAAERLMLRAVATEVERTGSDETTLSRALLAAAAIASLDGRPYRSAPNARPPTSSQALAICNRLAASRLILLESRATEPRLLLNISADDVHYATRQISV